MNAKRNHDWSNVALTMFFISKHQKFPPDFNLLIEVILEMSNNQLVINDKPKLTIIFYHDHAQYD